MNNEKWVNRMRDVAKMIATWSKDPNRQVGAIITTRDFHILATGYNGFPKGIDDLCLLDKNIKIIHAEINALLRLKTTETGLQMFIAGGFPCAQCAAAIIQSNIAKVYCDPIDQMSSWKRHMFTADEMFTESGITCSTW